MVEEFCRRNNLETPEEFSKRNNLETPEKFETRFNQEIKESRPTISYSNKDEIVPGYVRLGKVQPHIQVASINFLL